LVARVGVGHYIDHDPAQGSGSAAPLHQNRIAVRTVKDQQVQWRPIDGGVESGGHGMHSCCSLIEANQLGEMALVRRAHFNADSLARVTVFSN
jgi:hypothetical protein